MGPLIAAARPGVSFEAGQRSRVARTYVVLASMLITSAPSSRRAVGGLSKQTGQHLQSISQGYHGFG